MVNEALFKNHEIKQRNDEFILFSLSQNPFVTPSGNYYTSDDTDYEYAVFGISDDDIVAFVNFIKNDNPEIGGGNDYYWILLNTSIRYGNYVLNFDDIFGKVKEMLKIYFEE